MLFFRLPAHYLVPRINFPPLQVIHRKSKNRFTTKDGNTPIERLRIYMAGHRPKRPKERKTCVSNADGIDYRARAAPKTPECVG
ncbi:hypothetical protein VTO42DRAFT_1616 [Malbranchea cinnamomea]